MEMQMTQPIVEDVSLEELKAGLADGSIALVDVREANEWAAGHIPGATFNPLSGFDAGALPRKPGQRVVLHCRSGKRSITALGLAQQAGRDDVRAHFTGGMLEWQGAGEPVSHD
jgi:rhodanese-related sulfurtransferase